MHICKKAHIYAELGDGCQICQLEERDLLIKKFISAADAAIVHLEACQKGQIQHPFQSTSLPLLKEAVKEARAL